jgi:DNA polymerase-4
MVRIGDEHAFVAGLPVRRWPGIGPVTQQYLLSKGIETLGQLLAATGPLADSVRHTVFRVDSDSLGRDRPAFREHDPAGLTLGSISNETTFDADIGDLQTIRNQLGALCERVCGRARQRHVWARTITLKLRYAGFETLTRSRTIAPTSSEVVVFGCVDKLCSATYDRRRKLRLVGVALSHLVKGQRQQLLPFAKEERPNLGSAIDAVRDRFGFDAIHLGVSRLARRSPIE